MSNAVNRTLAGVIVIGQFEAGRTVTHVFVVASRDTQLFTAAIVVLTTTVSYGKGKILNRNIKY